MPDRVPANRRATPRPDEIAVLLLDPGETAFVDTEHGSRSVSGEDPLSPYAEVRLALVPYAPAAVGWGQTEAALYGVGAGDARTPTGLRAPVLRRVLRGHKLDEPVWAEARGLLASPARIVYVRQVAAPYYGRTRWTATAVRAHEEE